MSIRWRATLTVGAAFELPVACSRLALSYDAVVALGVAEWAAVVVFDYRAAAGDAVAKAAPDGYTLFINTTTVWLWTPQAGSRCP